MWHEWVRGERHTGFWWGKPKQRKKFLKNGQMILNVIFKKRDRRAWTGLNWLKLRISYLL
jgi:hypothetical protein